MRQNALTVVTSVKQSHLNCLDELLTRMGADIAGQATIPFGKLDLLHFASWIILETEEFGSQLVFESNFDGPVNGFLQQLTSMAYEGIHEIYEGCPDFPSYGDREIVRQFFLDHAVGTNTFYIGCVGLSRNMIIADDDLRKSIENRLGSGANDDDDAGHVRELIQEYVRRDSLCVAMEGSVLETLREQVLLWSMPVLALALGSSILGWVFVKYPFWGIGALAGLALALSVSYWLLLRRESTDSSITDEPFEIANADGSHVRRLVQREDRRPQNHLASLTCIKPGLFRGFLLKTVLALIDAAARYIFNKGNLGGIPSIHFARWVVINEGKQLLFLSNFDGSWEHYLGEFIDQAARGLTAVWSNTVGFPRTFGLFKGGATDEQRFKAYARRSQNYTQLWYSAYPFLSVTNILNNASIRRDMWGKLPKEELQAWLRRF